MQAYIDGAQDLVEEKLSHRLREFPDGHDSVKQLASFHTAGRREKRKERERGRMLKSGMNGRHGSQFQYNVEGVWSIKNVFNLDNTWLWGTSSP